MASETILVVEDNPAVQTLIFETLRTEGYTILSARHPEVARRVSEQHPGPIHMVITNVILPQTNEPAFAQHLQRLHPKIKVLFLSSHPFDELVHLGILSSDAAFLRKPFRLEALRIKVREALDAPPPPKMIYPRSDTAVDAVKVFLLLKSRPAFHKAYQTLSMIWKRRNGKKDKDSS